MSDHIDFERIAALHAARDAEHGESVSEAKARGGYARWGRTSSIEPRGQVAVSRSLVDEFFRTYPPELRRAGADYGIRKAIDDAQAVKAFHASFNKPDKQWE